MVTTDKLEDIIEKYRTILEFSSPLYPGYYYCYGKYYKILINKSIERNKRLYRTVLAEEIGH